jgi:hypothetical protein
MSGEKHMFSPGTASLFPNEGMGEGCLLGFY